MSFIKSLFTSAASFAIASKSGRLCAWIHEVCGLRMFDRPSLCCCPLQSSILEWVHVVLLHLEQSLASQTAAGRRWLGDLDWPGFSIRASWFQTDGVGMATLIEGTKKVGHLNLEAPHPGITRHYPASPCYQSTYSIIAALLTFHHGLV